MLRLFDLKQNVNSHAFKETAFLLRPAKMKERKKSTEQ